MASRTVFFVTNRRWDKPAGAFPAEMEPPPRLWPGRVEVARSADPAVDGDCGPPQVEGMSGDAAAVEAVVAAWLAMAERTGAVPLLSVHGFQYTFPQSLARAGNLCDWYEAGGAPALLPLAFCWPSRGELTPADYKADRGMAKDAAPALAALVRVVARLAAGAPRRPVWLGHSMGCWCTRWAMRELEAGGLPAGPVFDQALLMAGDDVPDALAQGLAPLAAVAGYVTIGVYAQDAVLDKVSQWIMGSGPRLGADGGPIPAPLADRVALVDYIQAVDGMKPTPDGGTTWNWVGHQWYRNDLRARIDIVQALRGVRPWAVLGRHPGRPGQPTWPERAGRLYVDGAPPALG